MNILFLSTWFPYPPDNGSKLRAYYLLRAISLHHEVVALAFNPFREGEQHFLSTLSPVPPVLSVHDDPFRYVNAPKIVKYTSFSPLSYRTSSAMFRAVAGITTRANWDAIVAVQMPVAQYVQSLRANARLIDVDTSLTFQMYERYRRQSALPRRLAAWISMIKSRRYESHMLQHFQAATVVCHPEADFLKQMAGDSPCRVEVIPNGVDTIHNRISLSQRQSDTLVFNGSLTYSANHDAIRWFLAEVYPLIKAERPHVRLVITGSTKGVDLASLSLDESVHLTGHVTDVRVPVVEAAACVVPIREGGGTRVKILESMALGTPVVSTTKGAEGLEVVDDDHLLLADTPADFARSVLSLLTNPGLQIRLAESARSLVEQKYDWGEIGKRFVALVESSVLERSTLPVRRR